jgi:IMP dehydrogenase
MTAYPISVHPDTEFQQTVEFMTNRKIANLIVMDNNKTQGVLTEREILKSICKKDVDISSLKVSDMGMQPYEVLSPNSSILDAAEVMVTKKSRPLIFDQDKLIGIITSTDLLRAFRLTAETPSIEPIVRTKLSKCRSSDKIIDAAKKMNENGVGSVIISDVAYYGIFTERDLLTRILSEKIDLDQTLLAYVTSPLISAQKKINAGEAAAIMAQHNFKRLGIMDGEDLAGIITARDLVEAFHDLYHPRNPYANLN